MAKRLGSQLFVSRLSNYTTNQKLEKLFSPFGVVKEARLVLDPRTQKPKGFGFVTFDSESQAQKALKAMDGRCWSRRSVSLCSTVSLGRWQWTRHSCTKLFVGGLSYDTNETVLKDAFRQHGEIIEVKIICDHVSGKSQGYGFVQFTSESAASMALKEMNGQFLDGRHVRVCFAHKG
ncbi:28 kDa ribonucleoprotein, chloroplastic isoform X3 [Hevea brasiliensis]|uniref:28 kDa ribonucleoprotein, chloroplastic isoform X3 n=1 Tax=Hevea brasiliensis TaxID=3981 RepID=UPI000B77B850|nr:28 kDa ribonucleoprotein, chloroplastic isoform X3 [Hevea brasiliensis]